MTLLRHTFNSTRFTYRSFMCQLYESRYVETSNNVVCGGLSSLAMNSDETADRYPPCSNVASLPEFLLWPRPKHYAVLRFLADLVQYIITTLFLFQLDTLLFSFFFTFTIFLYMFRTGWSIIRRIKCLFTRAA